MPLPRGPIAVIAAAALLAARLPAPTDPAPAAPDDAPRRADAGPAAGAYAEILVVDAETGRGVPLVELVAVNHLRFVTDNAGRVAFHEPDLMGRAVFFTVRSHGYQMKRDGYLINIGRGAIVDLADLVAALRASEIAGAALDVFEQEPLPPQHPLWRFENVILTPHVAGYSPRIAERHLGLLLDNVRRFVAGEPLRNVVNKAEWY